MQIYRLPVQARYTPASLPTAKPYQPLGHDRVCFSGKAPKRQTFIPQEVATDREEIHRVCQRYSGRAVEIPWESWGIAPLNTPLATLGLQQCRGLVIVDESQQFLAHLYPSNSQADIEQMLRIAQDEYDLDIENADIAMVLGTEESDSLEQELRNALDSVSPEREYTIDILQTEHENAESAGCAVVRGEVYGCRQFKELNRSVPVFEIDET